MKKTQLIIFHRPMNARVNNDDSDLVGSNYAYRLVSNPNEVISRTYQTIVRPAASSQSGLELDIYDDVSIPITYSILDVREPEKRKTSWSKTITIPGTANNNRIFSHIYEIGQDGWITVGNTSVYSGFNPNLRKEIIVLTDGVQVLKGNMQLKKVNKDKFGNITYDIALNGDLTSLFYDVGTAKLNDLDFSEWNHDWSKSTIQKTWNGVSVKVDGSEYQSISDGSSKTITNIYMDPETGRIGIQTSTAHGLLADDYVKIRPNVAASGQESLFTCYGDWVVTGVTSTTKFVINHPYPIALPSSGFSPSTSPSVGLSTCAKTTATGRGYVYPMISWGDEYDFNSFSTTNFVPGFYVKEIWDKIMAQTNSAYQSTFLDSQFFKRLILIQKKPTYDLNPAEVNSRRFWVGITQSYTTGASFKTVNNYIWPNFTNVATASYTKIGPSLTANRFPFIAESETPGLTFSINFFDNANLAESPLGNWREDEKKWIVQDSGEYSIGAGFKVTAWCDMNGFDGGLVDGTASFSPLASGYSYYPGTSGIYFSGGPLGSYKTGLRLKASVKRLRGGVVTEIGSNFKDFVMNPVSNWTPTNTNWASFGRYQPPTWKDSTFELSVTSQYFSKGDEVWVEFQQYVQCPASSNSPYTNPTRTECFAFYEFDNSVSNEIYRTAIRGEWFYRIEPSCFIYNDPSAKSSENAAMEANSFLPKDLTCKDFLLGVIKMFNLHIEPDRQIERLYYIEPRDDYYYDGSGGSTDYVDWSDKIDEESVEITPLGELIAKFYTFQNKEENDYWNKKFKDDRGRAYSSYTKEIENDFLKNEVKIEVPFGTTIMINNPDKADVVMPAILQKEANGSAKPVSNSLPRILIWGGLRPYTANRGGSYINLSNPNFPNYSGWEMLSAVNVVASPGTSSIFNYYPYAGTVDSPMDPLYDVNWYNMEADDFVYYDHARWTNENLYNKYWKNFLLEVSDPASKVITAKLRLTPKDVFNLDFRKIYLIDNNYLRLQKVYDYDPTQDGLTKCEFLKLKSPSKFRRRSILVEGPGQITSVFAQVVDGTRPVSVTNVEVAPVRKKPDFGYTNTSFGSSLSNNATITLSGLSNFVGNGSKNIKVNGNENAIGANANNVHISSGNGNYIIGGVTNVNVIGTDKKYIAESDVTYINGIRYKNGMPISKANVINGGLDVAVVRQSDSTTANVINASEDVVIFGGSTTYENVVNSGVDSILPDVAELGIVSTTNPNPRTNFSGGFVVDDLNIASQSLIQVVRQASRLRS